MSTAPTPSTPLPSKQDLPKEIWRLATTLSDDMQATAVRKARESGFDLSKGRLSLDETLINLSRDRDTLIDAVDQEKIVQLPLKVQYSLYVQTQKISEILTALANGTDSILALEDAVDDLTATFWQYNLHNLSREILGFHQKMNQLKAQETLIRGVHQEAKEFEKSTARAKDLLIQIENVLTTSTESTKAIPETVSQVTSLLAKATEQEQVIAGLVVRTQQNDAAASQHEANAKTATAEIQAIAGRLPTLQAEIETAKNSVNELNTKASGILGTFETNSESSIKSLGQEFTKFADSATAEIAEQKLALDALLQKTRGELEQLRTDQDSLIATRLDTIKKGSDQALEQFQADGKASLSSAKENFDSYKTEAEKQNGTLSSHLEELEGKIKESIQRATGFTLFHSFQKRQLDLARSKNIWAIALACVVSVSIGLSIWFIYYLSHRPPSEPFGPSFYLKLSVSLPIIYAITFCSLQYSRERRLEEEYAFKSSISISLEPYQKLVEGLVDKKNPEELAKYTAFIIESVGRVFTSPVGLIFDDPPKDSRAAEGIVKAVGDVVKVAVQK